MGGNTRTFSTQPLFSLALSLLHIFAMHEGANVDDDDDHGEDCDGDDKEGDLLSTVIFGQEAQKLRANSKMERIPLFWKLLPPLMMMMVRDATSK